VEGAGFGWFPPLKNPAADVESGYGASKSDEPNDTERHDMKAILITAMALSASTAFGQTVVISGSGSFGDPFSHNPAAGVRNFYAGADAMNSIASANAAVSIARMQFYERELLRARAAKAEHNRRKKEQWERTRGSQQARWDTRKRSYVHPPEASINQGRMILAQKLIERGHREKAAEILEKL